jgi:rhodanese-related sulfurtransferase
MLRVVLFAFTLFAAATAFAGELQIKELKKGEGEEAVLYSKAKVHYTGWLMDGTKFDSSLDRDKPFTLTLGMKQVIPGWEQGLVGMRVGGKRELIIPPELGYGKRGAGDVIPPNATLKFEVELLEVAAPKFSNIDNAELKKLLDQGTKIVDIRRPEEWKQTGVVDGSILLTAFGQRGLVKSFPDEFGKQVEKDEPVILICRTGNRTAAISQALSEQLGYEKIINVTDGITRWIKEGNPIRKDCPEFVDAKRCS